MSYKLQKTYTEKERLDFIVTYNHNQGFKIIEAEGRLYALEPNEIFRDGLVIVDPDYEAKQVQKERIEKIAQIKEQLLDIDTKRIRAMCEPSERDDGQDWLDYYNEQAKILRNELQKLETKGGLINDSNINE